MGFKTSLLVSTMLAGMIAAGKAHAADDADAAQPPAGSRGAGQPGVSPPGSVPGVGAGASTNATGSAQQQLNQGRTGQPDSGTVSEIVVTAEKREQSLQQVPVAVTAFTTERRDLIGIQSIVDQTNFTPGLTYQPNLDRVSIRGIGRLTNVHTADSGTALYTDGVFTTSTTDAGRDPIFIDRTEILRGPQGTLYGRNAIAGAFNTITKRPTSELSGEARVTVGNYDLQRYAATLAGPITDWLRFRVGYEKIYQGDGYDRNLTGLKSETGARDRDYYQVQFDGTVGKVDFWVYYDQQHWNDRSTPGLTTNGGTLAPPEINYFGNGGGLVPNASYGFGGGLNTVFQGPVAGNPVLQGYSLRDFEHDTEYRDKLSHNDVFRTHLTYHAPDFDIKYVGGYLRYNYHYDTYDADGTSVQSYQVPLNPTAAPIANVPALGGGVNCFTLAKFGACSPATVNPGQIYSYTEQEEFYSHEVTIASTWDSPLQYIAGLYYYHENSENPSDVYDPGQLQIRTPSGPGALGIAGLPTTALASPQGDYLHNNYFFNIDSRAVYAQVDYKVIPTVKLTGGIRYTQDKKNGVEEERVIEYGLPSITDLTRFGSTAPAFDITQLSSGVPANGAPQQGVIRTYFNPVNGYEVQDLKDGWNDVTGTAGVEWTPDRRTLAYAKYSRGYKAGGFATIQALTFASQPYSLPEQINNFEAGFKKDWTRHLQTNVTGFYDVYYDAQVPLAIPTQGASSQIFYNIPKSIVQGVELETIYSPIDKLNILFNYGYLDSHITRSNGAADPNDPTATQPGATPSGGASSTGGLDPITGLPTRGQNLRGQNLPLSPHHKLSLNLNYDYEIGKYGDLIPSFSYLYRSGQYSSIFNRSYNYAPGRDQIDVRVTYKPPNSKFEIIGYVQNLTNNTSFETKSGVRYSTGAVYSTYTLLDPRTYGLQVQARF